MKGFYESSGVHGYSQIPRLETAMTLLKNVKANRVLDLGCGDGTISCKIGSLVSAQEIHGADISKEAVRRALSRGVKAIQLDLNEQKMPFIRGSFDLVVALELIEHLTDPDGVIEEMARVLSFGGLILLSTPNLANWMNRITILFGFQPWGTEVSTRMANFGKAFAKQETPVGHLRMFTLRSFKEFILFHGLCVKEVRGANFSQNGFLGLLDSILSRQPSLAPVIIFLLGKDTRALSISE